MSIYEICGWLGAILVLIAYYMVTTGKARGDSHMFQLINISGALMLVAYTFNCQAYASMIVNIIWVLIGITSFAKYIKLHYLKLALKTRAKALITTSIIAIVGLIQF